MVIALLTLALIAGSFGIGWWAHHWHTMRVQLRILDDQARLAGEAAAIAAQKMLIAHAGDVFLAIRDVQKSTQDYR